MAGPGQVSNTVKYISSTPVLPSLKCSKTLDPSTPTPSSQAQVEEDAILNTSNMGLYSEDTTTTAVATGGEPNPTTIEDNIRSQLVSGLEFKPVSGLGHFESPKMVHKSHSAKHTIPSSIPFTAITRLGHRFTQLPGMFSLPSTIEKVGSPLLPLTQIPTSRVPLGYTPEPTYRPERLSNLTQDVAQTITSENTAEYQQTVKNKSEDFFRDCSSNLHTALETINTNAKDWLDVGREGAHVGIMLVSPGIEADRPPRLITVIGYVNASYLSKPSFVGSSLPSWSIVLVISETTFKDLLRLVSTGARKVHIDKNGQPNFYIPFRRIDGRYELKLRAKVSYFEAVRVAQIQEKVVHEKHVLNQVTTARGYVSDEEGQFRLLNPGHIHQPAIPGELSRPVGVQEVNNSENDSATTDSDIELPDVESKDWKNSPFPNIYDSTTIPVMENAAFLPTLHSNIVPKCLVAARCFTQFWDFGVDGKQRTGYSMQLESLHLINYSSDHRVDLIPKAALKRFHPTINRARVGDSRKNRYASSLSILKRATFSDL